MKKLFKIALFALVAIGVANCSSDESLSNNAEINGTIETGNYAVFQVGQIGSETRATSGGYDAGLESEFAVSKKAGANFVIFYDANKDFHSVAFLEAGELEDGKEAEKIFKVNIQRDNKDIKYCLLVLNGDQDLLATLRSNSMADAKSIIDNTFMGWNAEGYFMMTNSVYTKEGEIQTEVEIDPSTHFCATPEEAALNPITVYVERVLAKFTINYADKPLEAGTIITPEKDEVTVYTGKSGEDFTFATGKKWQIEITGWGINATETATYLFKNLGDMKFGNWSSDLSGTTLGWNDLTRRRSYWAVDPHYDTEDASLYPEQFRSVNENIVSGQPDANTFDKVRENLPLNYFSYDEIVKNTAAQQYSVENTFAYSWLTNDNVYRVGTHFVVAAKLRIADSNGTYAANTVYNYNRAYWYEDAKEDLKEYMFKQVVARYMVEYGKLYTDATQTTEFDNIDASKLDLVAANVKNGDGRVKLAFTDNMKLYDDKGNDATEKFAAIVNEWGTARRFDGGSMYYAIPIEHLVTKGTTNYEVGSYGVVRNHWYKANIAAINNPGIPVDKPGQPIIPNDDPDEDGYASFEIVIIPWHIVNWDIEL